MTDIFQIINFIVMAVLIYLLWNKKYITHYHITIILDHSGKIVRTVVSDKPMELPEDVVLTEKKD